MTSSEGTAPAVGHAAELCPKQGQPGPQEVQRAALLLRRPRGHPARLSHNRRQAPSPGGHSHAPQRPGGGIQMRPGSAPASLASSCRHRPCSCCSVTSRQASWLLSAPITSAARRPGPGCSPASLLTSRWGPWGWARPPPRCQASRRAASSCATASCVARCVASQSGPWPPTCNRRRPLVSQGRPCPAQTLASGALGAHWAPAACGPRGPREAEPKPRLLQGPALPGPASPSPTPEPQVATEVPRVRGDSPAVRAQLGSLGWAWTQGLVAPSRPAPSGPIPRDTHPQPHTPLQGWPSLPSPTAEWGGGWHGD